jgi:hypothetical protein
MIKINKEIKIMIKKLMKGNHILTIYDPYKKQVIDNEDVDLLLEYIKIEWEGIMFTLSDYAQSEEDVPKKLEDRFKLLGRIRNKYNFYRTVSRVR